MTFRWLFLAASLMFAGCSDVEPAGMPVSGKIAFQGQPLVGGTVEFHPESPEGTFSGAMTAEDGTYTIPAENGLSPGPYRVRISLVTGAAQVSDPVPGESADTGQERIPPAWNVESEQVVEVKSKGDNVFNFEIP